MYTVSIKLGNNYNSVVTIRCPVCQSSSTKAWWPDTPIRNLYARCLTCRSKTPDYETLLRSRKARIFMHLTKKLPQSGRGIME